MIAGISIVPWIIKFLWSGIIDRFSQIQKKIFILIGGSLGTLCFFTLFFINPSVTLLLFTFIFFMSHVFISFFDSAADIWAIEISTKEERGKINAAMQAGLWIGGGTSAILFSSIARIYDYPIVFPIAGIIILIISLFPLIIKEEKTTIKQKKITPLLIKEFKDKIIQKMSMYASLISISSGILTITIPLYLRNILDLDVAQVGTMAAIVPLMIVPGNIIGGHMADKNGRKQTIIIFILMKIIFTIFLIFSYNWWLLIIIYGIVLLVDGGFTSAQGALFMDLTNPKVGATQFSLFSGFMGLGDVGGRMIAGLLIVLVGFTNLFILSGLILIPPLILLSFIKIRNEHII